MKDFDVRIEIETCEAFFGGREKHELHKMIVGYENGKYFWGVGKGVICNYQNAKRLLQENTLYYNSESSGGIYTYLCGDKVYTVYSGTTDLNELDSFVCELYNQGFTPNDIMNMITL